MKKWLATAMCASSAFCGGEQPNVIIILTDDWGHADLGIHGVLDDIQTPNLDRLAREGVLFTDGYITAPQCAPSRAGLLTGRYQQRFGYDCIGLGPMPLTETTIAERLKKAGYVTGHVGKWHVEPNGTDLAWALEHHPEIVENNRIARLGFDLLEPYYPHRRGFDEHFSRRMSPYFINFDLAGNTVNPPRRQAMDGFRVDVHTEAALTFVKRNKDKPFFLYLAHFAPHVPLEAPQHYLDRFPGDMPERRRYGLAMMSAVDDGIGRLMDLLEAEGLRLEFGSFFIRQCLPVLRCTGRLRF
jgi:arylsulfatase A-like enzyme